MNVSQVNQATDLRAMKKMMSLSQEQASKILSPVPGPRAANLEPHKGTLIDVRL